MLQAFSPRLLAFTLIASLLISACGADSSTPPTARTSTTEASATRNITVILKDFEIEPQFTTTSAGIIAFGVVNRGALDHEFIVVRTDTDFDKLPTESAVVHLNSVSFDGITLGNTKKLKSQAMESFKVRLEPGRYVLLCNIAGHYELGMRIPFKVE